MMFKLTWQIISKRKATNGEIGPAADQIYEIWSCTIFVIWVFRGKSKLSIYTKHLLLMFNLDERQTCTVFNFLILLKISIFAHLSLSIFLYPHPSIKNLDIQRIFWKRSKRLWLQKLDQRLGRMWIKWRHNYRHEISRDPFAELLLF